MDSYAPGADIGPFRKLLDLMPQLVWTARPDGYRDFYNKGFYNYTGKNFDQIKGFGWESIRDPALLPAVKKRWQESLKGGSPFEMEFHLLGGDGNYRWFLARINPIHDDKGTLVGWVGTNTDIQDKKESEQALEERVQERTEELEKLLRRIKESESKFRAIFDQTFQLVSLVSKDGTLLEANQTALDFIGAERDEIVGRSFWTTPYWSHSELAQAQLKEAIAEAAAGNFVRFEAEHFGVGGRRDIDFSLKPVKVATDTVMLIAEGRDITEIKEAEREIKEQAALLDLTHDTVIVRTIDGIIRFWNRGAAAMYGYSKEEAIGRVSHELLRTKFPKSLASIEAELLQNARWEGELIHSTKDDRIITVDSRLALETDLNQSQKVLEINNDITVRKMAESKILQMAADLARSNKDLEQFAYAASHDMQEPLRTVISFCDLLVSKTQVKLDPDSEKYLAVIVESTSRMQQMIKDLLLYARLEAPGKVITAIDSQEALSQAISSRQKAIAESGAEIVYDKLPVVMADTTQLSLLFQNLLSNAIKFRGTEPLKIKIESVRQGPLWQFSVFGNGIGMDMAYADRIFIIFQRLHSRSKYQGTGIGLALCKRIVERHGGSIKVKSAPNKGSVFIFTLRHPAGD